MPAPAITSLPGAAYVWFRPGLPVLFQLNFPAGVLGDREFTAVLDGEDLQVEKTGSDRLTVSAPSDQTTGKDEPVNWALLENDVPIIEGAWYPSYEPIPNPEPSITILMGDPSFEIGMVLLSGIPGQDASEGASGTQSTPSLVWIMTHNSNISEAELNPELWSFRDQDGNLMEPEQIQYVNDNQALAVWLDDPVAGSWRYS